MDGYPSKKVMVSVFPRSNFVSSCIPRLVVSTLRALIGSEEYEHCVEVVNALFAPANELEDCLNTQNTPDILTLTSLAASKLLEQGKSI